MRHDGAVEATRRAQVEILDAGGLPEGRELQAGGQAFGGALGGLAIDQEAETILEAKRLEGWAATALLVRAARAIPARPSALRRSEVGWVNITLLLLSGNSPAHGYWRGAGGGRRVDPQGRPGRVRSSGST